MSKAVQTGALEDINSITARLIRSGTARIEDLTAVAVPVRLPVVVRVAFDAKRPPFGQRMVVHVNGKVVSCMRHDEDGRASCRSDAIDITDMLNKGRNELRVRCFVTADPFGQASDEGKITVLTEGTATIKKKFCTRSTAEPWDQIWTLNVLG